MYRGGPLYEVWRNKRRAHWAYILWTNMYRCGQVHRMRGNRSCVRTCLGRRNMQLPYDLREMRGNKGWPHWTHPWKWHLHPLWRSHREGRGFSYKVGDRQPDHQGHQDWIWLLLIAYRAPGQWTVWAENDRLHRCKRHLGSHLRKIWGNSPDIWSESIDIQHSSWRRLGLWDSQNRGRGGESLLWDRGQRYPEV